MDQYVVYHADNPTFDGKKAASYTLVALVLTTSLGEAFRLTNHIDSPWWDNPEVDRWENKSYRSTSVGDIIEVQGEQWLCKPAGWEKVL
jgi:hypothetical protein